MKVANGQAQSFVGHKPPVGRNHVHRGRLEGVVRREHKVTMVLTPGIRGILGSRHDVVPEMKWRLVERLIGDISV